MLLFFGGALRFLARQFALFFTTFTACVILVSAFSFTPALGQTDFVLDTASTETNGSDGAVPGTDVPISNFDDTFTVTSNGSIINPSAGPGAIWFENAGNNTITNNGILEVFGGLYGIFLNSSASSFITNNGTIIANDGGGYGIANDSASGNNITNTGTITVTGLVGKGIWNENSSNAIITNTGTITTTNTGSHGIDLENSNDVVLTNSGNLTTSGDGSYGIEIAPNSNGATVLNSGSIQTSGAASHGIMSSNNLTSSSTITNTGLIQVTGTGSNGIRFVDFVGTLINSGSIFAADPLTENVISFADAGLDDYLELRSGTRLVGRIQMDGVGGFGAGTGIDTIVLNHGGQDIAWRWTFEDFDTASDTLSVIGAPFVVDASTGDSQGAGVTVTVIGLANPGAASGIVSDLSGAVRTNVFGRLDQIVALQDVDETVANGYAASASARGSDGFTAVLGDSGTSAASGHVWQGWTSVFGGMRDRSANGATTGYNHGWGGLVVGADRKINSTTRLGGFGGYARSVVTFDNGQSDIDTNTFVAGAYSRLENEAGLFTDLALTTGYTDGDPGARLQANNLVVGGIETLEGGKASGLFVMPSLRVGKHIPLSETSNTMLIPSATLSYTQQWREGYTETGGGGAQTIDDHRVAVLSGRLELAARTTRVRENGSTWTSTLRGGLEGQQDLSEDIQGSVAGIPFTAQFASDEFKIDGFAGVDLGVNVSDKVALTLQSELVSTLSGADDIAANVNVNLNIRF